MAKNIFTGEEIAETPEALEKQEAKGRNIFDEGKKNKKPERTKAEILKQNIKEFGQQLGEKGLDMQIGTLNLLENILYPEFLNTVGNKMGMKKSRIPEKLTPRPSEMLRSAQKGLAKVIDEPERAPAPTTRGGHLGAGVGTAVGIPIPGAMGVSTLGGLASGELQNLGVDPMYADVAGAFSPLVVEQAVTKLPKAVSKTVSGAQSLISKVAPTANQTEQNAANTLQRLMGNDAVEQAIAKLQGFDPSKLPEGYNATTGEIIQNPSFSAEQRRRRDLPKEGGNDLYNQMEKNNRIINETLSGVGGKADAADAKTFVTNYEKSRTKDLNDLQKNAERGLIEETRREIGQSSSIESAGNAVQNALEQERILAHEARAPATAEYEAIEQSTDHRIPVNDTLDAINQQLKSAKGEVETSLIKIRDNYLKSNEGIHIPGPEGTVIPTPTAHEIHLARGQIQDDINAAYKAGRTQQGEALKKVRDALDAEVTAKYPQLTDARQAYREQSRDYNALVEHKALGADVKAAEYGEGFNAQASTVPKKYIKGDKAAENMEALLPILERHPEARQQMQEYVNSTLFEELFDKNGNITTGNLDTWRNNNKGAFILDPTLETKLENVSNTRKYVTDLAKSNAEHLKELSSTAAHEILGKDANRIMSGVLDRPNTGEILDDAFNLAARDPTGMATEGVKQALVEDIKRKIGTLAENKTGVSIDKYTSFFDKNKEHLAKHFDANQMKALQEIDNVLAGRNAVETQIKPKGSPTAPLTSFGQFMQDAWSKIPAVTRGGMHIGMGGASALTGGVPGMIAAGVATASTELALARAKRLTEQVIDQVFSDPKFAEKIFKKAGIQRKEAGVSFVQKALKDSIIATNRANATKVQQRQNMANEEAEE